MHRGHAREIMKRLIIYSITLFVILFRLSKTREKQETGKCVFLFVKEVFVGDGAFTNSLLKSIEHIKYYLFNNLSTQSNTKISGDVGYNERLFDK